MKKAVYTPNAPAAVGAYSQAVKANGFVFTAGQLGIDPGSGVIVAGDVAGQTRQALANIRAILRAAGSAPTSIVKATIYVTDLQLFGDVNTAYAEFFAQEGVSEPPARAIAEVSALPMQALIEISAIALLEA